MIAEKTQPAAMVATSEATKLKNLLREAAGKAGEKAYQRLGWALQLLDDKTWIASEHNGDYDAAYTTVEIEFFADLCGALPIGDLFILRQQVPEETWKQHKYNLQRVRSAYERMRREERDAEREQEEPATKTRTGPVSTAEHKKVVEQAEHWQAVAKTQADKVQAAESELERLRREVQEKNVEIGSLRGEIKALTARTNAQEKQIAELTRLVERNGLRQR